MMTELSFPIILIIVIKFQDKPLKVNTVNEKKLLVVRGLNRKCLVRVLVGSDPLSIKTLLLLLQSYRYKTELPLMYVHYIFLSKKDKC